MGARVLDENIVLHVADVSHRTYDDVCTTLSRIIDAGLGEPNPGAHTTCVGGSAKGPLLGMDLAPAAYRRTYRAAPDFGLRLSRHLDSCNRIAETESVTPRGRRESPEEMVRRMANVTSRVKTCIRNAYFFDDLYQGSSLFGPTLPPPRGTADRYLTELLDHDPEPVAFVTEDLGPDTHTTEQVTVISTHTDLQEAMVGNIAEGTQPLAADPVEAAGRFLVGRLRRSGLALGGGPP
ncbi:MAG: hypothetical protein KGJ23_08670 [Euryarchaeota archaeon]|nr:hypothetical protein [Euryarchaeota archaeon]MDE1836676.1 hypothetical protein [Euryarchaeota archaeon]MDE1880295.1 hypothetical protein [Euryarchaeota archaeon]MDE2044646.1 hypothetical protein [Thermoplasmata archaeon]